MKTVLIHTLQNESVRKQLTNGERGDSSSSGSSTGFNNDNNNDASFSKSENTKMPAVTPPNHNNMPVLSSPQKDPVLACPDSNNSSESIL